jgi:hypothetical protein
VSGQKTKLVLRLTSKTCLQIWLVKLFQSLLSILPLIFNRVTSSTDSLNGFEKSCFESSGDRPLGPSEDLEAKIGSFLRIQEKDGLAHAVAIVMNGSRISSRLKSMIVLQQGFSLYNDTTTKTRSSSLSELDFSTFPAIYFRESTQSSSPGLLRIRRTSSSTKDELRGEEKELADSAKCSQFLQNSSVVWPHNSWPNPVPFLTSEPTSEEEFTNKKWHWIHADAKTLLYSTPINSNMWFVVMIKAADKNQSSHRRPTKVLEKDVQDELIEIVGTLRLSDVFKGAHVLEIRRGALESGSAFSNEAGRRMLLGTSGDGHNTFMELLQSFKDELGLRYPRQRELRDPSYGFDIISGRIGTTSSIRLRKTKSGSSHLAYFLGEELINSL